MVVVVFGVERIQPFRAKIQPGSRALDSNMENQPSSRHDSKVLASN